MHRMIRLVAMVSLAVIAMIPMAAWSQLATDSFAMLLTLPDGHSQRVAIMLSTPMRDRALPAVVIVPDEAGLDGRTAQLADLMLTQGWVAIQIDPEPLSADGAAVPSPPAPRRLGHLLQALHEGLQTDERINPRRVVVLGLGSGGRGALHAAQSKIEPRFAAHAALYPGCADLTAELQQAPDVPTLLLLPGAEEPEGACSGVGAIIQRLPNAAYGWDHVIAGPMRRLPSEGFALMRPDRLTAEAGEAALTSFFAAALTAR